MKTPAENSPSLLEALEPRIAPATLLPDGKTVSFIDEDGDHATIKFNQKVTQEVVVNVIKFTGSDFGDSGLQLLGEIDLTAWGFAAGASEKFALELVTKQGGGNGTTRVGAINASGLDINSIKLSGDLGQITVGNTGNANKTALKTLQAGTIGVWADPGTNSTFWGSVGSLKTKGDIEGSNITVHGGAGIPAIGVLEIGGDLAGSAGGGTVDNAGKITVNGSVTSATIKGRLSGGEGANSGSLTVNGDIKSLIVGHIEGEGTDSGKISVTGNVGTLQTLNVTGGSGENSGRVEVSGTVKKASLGAVVGREGENSGSVVISQADTVFISAIEGGAGLSSGVVTFLNGAKSVQVGEIIGGGGENSGVLKSENAPILNIITGDIAGGAGVSSGQVAVAAGDFNGDGKADIITKASFGRLDGGDVADSGVITLEPFVKGLNIFRVNGGDGNNSAVVELPAGGGKIVVTRGISGGEGDASGVINAGAPIGSFSALSLVGGFGDDSGRVDVLGSAQDVISSVTIMEQIRGRSADGSGVFHTQTSVKTFSGKDILGGSGKDSGRLVIGGDLGTIKFTGSVVGENGENSGSLSVNGNIGTLTIAFDLRGASGADSGSVSTNGSIGTANLGRMLGTDGQGGGILSSGGGIGKLNIKTGIYNESSVSIGGDLGSLALGEILNASGWFQVGGNLGTATIKGGISGGMSDPFLLNVIGGIGSEGKLPAINKLSIGGSVSNCDIVAGFNVYDDSINNPNAYVNSVSVKGGFTNSSISVNVVDVDNKGYGAPSNEFAGTSGASATSGLRSVVIGGEVVNNGVDFIGIVASHVTKAKIGGQTIALTAGPRNDSMYLNAGETIVLSEFPPMV